MFGPVTYYSRIYSNLWGPVSCRLPLVPPVAVGGTGLTASAVPIRGVAPDFCYHRTSQSLKLNRVNLSHIIFSVHKVLGLSDVLSVPEIFASSRPLLHAGFFVPRPEVTVLPRSRWMSGLAAASPIPLSATMRECSRFDELCLGSLI